MRARLLIMILVCLIALSSSGCLLGLAAAIRWDQRRAARMEKEKEQEDEKCLK